MRIKIREKNQKKKKKKDKKSVLHNSILMSDKVETLSDDNKNETLSDELSPDEVNDVNILELLSKNEEKLQKDEKRIHWKINKPKLNYQSALNNSFPLKKEKKETSSDNVIDRITNLINVSESWSYTPAKDTTQQDIFYTPMPNKKTNTTLITTTKTNNNNHTKTTDNNTNNNNNDNTNIDLNDLNQKKIASSPVPISATNETLYNRLIELRKQLNISNNLSKSLKQQLLHENEKFIKLQQERNTLSLEILKLDGENKYYREYFKKGNLNVIPNELEKSRTDYLQLQSSYHELQQYLLQNELNYKAELMDKTSEYQGLLTEYNKLKEENVSYRILVQTHKRQLHDHQHQQHQITYNHQQQLNKIQVDNTTKDEKISILLAQFNKLKDLHMKLINKSKDNDEIHANMLKELQIYQQENEKLTKKFFTYYKVVQKQLYDDINYNGENDVLYQQQQQQA